MNDDTTPASAGDGFDFPQSERTGDELPPHLASLLESVEATTREGEESGLAALESAIAEAEAEVNDASTDLHLVLSELAGAIDSDLEAAELATDKILERAITTQLETVIRADIELQEAGVYVPLEIDRIALDLLDTSGVALTQRLMGQAPIPGGTDDVGGSIVRPGGGAVPGDRERSAVGGDIGSGPPPGDPFDDGDPDTPKTGLGDTVECRIDPETGETICGGPGLPPPGGGLPEPPEEPEPPGEPDVPPGPGEEPPVDEPCHCEETDKICLPASALEVCIPKSLLPCEPLPPPPPPAPPPEEEPEPEPIKPEIPKATPPEPIPGARVLPYHSPEIGAEVAGWTRWFGEFSKWFRKEVNELEEYGAKLTGEQEDWLWLGITGGVLKKLVAKLAFSDPTIPEFIHQVIELDQNHFRQRTAEGVNFGWKYLYEEHVKTFGPEGDALYGLYAAKSMLLYMRPMFMGWLAQNQAAPSAALVWEQLETIVDVCIKHTVPVVPPDLTAVQLLWLQGRITDNHAETLVRTSGQQWPITLMTWQQLRQRPGIQDAVSLWRRGEMTEEELNSRCKDLGVMDEHERNLLVKLSEFTPPYTDLVRFMVRDSADENLVNLYQYDKDFTTKFGPLIEHWAKSQGISPQVFRYIWRAHWQLPSATQLYELLHRLRPDRPEVQEWDRLFGHIKPEDRSAETPPRPPVVLPEDVQQTLEANDLAPRFVAPLMAMSYHPITRTDAIDAFHADAFGVDDLYHAMRDNGYDAVNAQRLVVIQQAKKARRLTNLTGVWSIRKTVKAYQDGAIDGVTCDQTLAPLIIDPGQRQAVILGADLEVAANTRRQWIKRARRAYFVGEWTAEETAANLLANQVPPPRAAQLVEQWTADIRGRYREPTARQIIAWTALGVITLDDAFRRLTRLGYSEGDSTRIVYQGVDAWRSRTQSMIRQGEADVRRIIKDAKQASKEEAARLEKRKKEIEAQLKELEKERERIEKEQEKRKKQQGGGDSPPAE